MIGIRRLGVGISSRGGGGSFKILVDTTKAGSASDTMIIPTTGSGFDCTVNWGDGDSDSYTGTPGLTTIQHTYDEGGEYTISISGTFPRIYFNNVGDKLKLLSVTKWGNYGLDVTDQSNAFYGCTNNTSIAADWKLDSVLQVGSLMFYNNPLTSLPANMTLSSLLTGSSMFQLCTLTALPTNMTLAALKTGTNMFFNNRLTSLTANMTLAALITGVQMFYNNLLTSLPANMTLASLTNGSNMFAFNTIETSDYSTLLVNIEANNINTGVAFHGGLSKYNATGQVARNALLARTPAWVITDGGLET